MNEPDKRILEEFDELLEKIGRGEIVDLKSFLLEKLHEARAVGRGEAVDYIKNHKYVSGSFEGHDGEEPVGEFRYDVPEYVLELAARSGKEGEGATNK